jgi:hypothetical protein
MATTPCTLQIGFILMAFEIHLSIQILVDIPLSMCHKVRLL